MSRMEFPGRDVPDGMSLVGFSCCCVPFAAVLPGSGKGNAFMGITLHSAFILALLYKAGNFVLCIIPKKYRIGWKKFVQIIKPMGMVG